MPDELDLLHDPVSQAPLETADATPAATGDHGDQRA